MTDTISTLDATEIARLKAEVAFLTGQLESERSSVSRLTSFIEHANKYANLKAREGEWGQEYIDVLEYLAASAPKEVTITFPIRKYEVDVTVSGTVRCTVSVNVEAKDEEDANRIVNEMIEMDEIDTDAGTMGIGEILHHNRDLRWDLEDQEAEIDGFNEID